MKHLAPRARPVTAPAIPARKNVTPRNTLAVSKVASRLPAPAQIALAKKQKASIDEKRARCRPEATPERAAAAKRGAQGVALAQRDVVAQNLDRAVRQAQQKSKGELRKQMQKLAYSQLELMAKKQMAEQHAINKFWPHGMGWSPQRAVVTSSSSPLAVAAQIQPPPLPPMEAKIVAAPVVDTADGFVDMSGLGATPEKKIPWAWLAAAAGALLILKAR